MKFESTKRDIQQIAVDYSYTASNIEKVIRLCLILEDLNNLDEFRGKLLLKGGTAINLIAFQDLPRLSVDLDLDYANNLTKDEIIIERDLIKQALYRYSECMSYRITERNNYSLDSFSLIYETTTGSVDKIKLDINYLSRCHVYPYKISRLKFPFHHLDKDISVAHLDYIELFAGKIKAFYERSKPRDIYDIFTLSKSDLLSTKEEREKLRKCVVFYLILGNATKPDLIKQDLEHIRKMPFQAIKTQLIPMLHTKIGRFDKDQLFDQALNYLQSLMILQENETYFLEKFFRGEFCPELLFGEEISQNLRRHPVVLHTLNNIRKSL